MSSLRGFNGEKRQTDIINQLIKIDSKTGVLPTGGASEAKQDTIIANQTNGTQESKCMGITGAGLQQQLKVESDGSSIIGGGHVKTAISTVDGSTQSIQVDATGALIVRTDNSNDSIRITGLNSAGANKGVGVEDTDGGILSAGKVVVATPTHSDGTRQLLRLNASGELMVNDSSGGGGGSSSLTFSTATIINAGTTVADFASAEGIIDLGSTVPETGTPKEIYITTTMTVAVSATIEIQLSVDNITYFQDLSFSSAFISSLSNLTRSSTIVNPSGYSTFSFPRYVKFIFRNQDGTGQSTDMGLKINYYA